MYKHKSCTRWWLPAALVVVIVCLGGTAASRASTVLPMSLEQMADHSGQVLIGRVSTVRAYWADNPRRIESEVTFEQVEYLKGQLPDSGSTFKLVVPGGHTEEKGMFICCAPRFKEGQKWVIMLLPTYRTFPVVGLYQGAFRVQADDEGIERVFQDDHGRLIGVTGISEEGFVQTVQRHSSQAADHLKSARGARLKPAPEAEGKGGPITLEEFRAKLDPVLEASKEHRLSEPAGRRLVGRPPIVPLRKAPNAAQTPKEKEDESVTRAAQQVKKIEVTPRQPQAEK